MNYWSVTILVYKNPYTIINSEHIILSSHVVVSLNNLHTAKIIHHQSFFDETTDHTCCQRSSASYFFCGKSTSQFSKGKQQKSKCTKVYVLHDNLWVVVKGKRGYCMESVAK